MRGARRRVPERMCGGQVGIHFLSPRLCSSQVYVGKAPERRDGTRCLSLIPNEIYMMIFEELQPLLYGYTINEHKRTIASLCLVCSFFRAICQPRMFHHLTFKGNASTTIAKRQANWRASLAVRDARCVALSSHIKSCAYQEWMADLDQEWIYTGLLQKNLQSASFLQSLKSVTLRQCTVTPSVLFALANIPRLLEVEMLLCETTPVSLDGLAGIPRRGWTSISITRCYYMTHYLTPALMKLIDHGQLRTLVAPDRTAADLVEAIILADAPSTSRLENLDVFFPRTSTAAFLNYLTRARDLRKLVVRSPNTTIANSNNITLRCKVKLSDAMGGRLLFCTINLFALYDFDVAVYRAVLGAWNPSPTLQNLSFNMTIDYDRAENSAESNLPRAVILPIFELLWRMKVSCR